MSLLSEQQSSALAAAVADSNTTVATELMTPPVRLSTGSYGELALTGDNLVTTDGDTTYLNVAVNGTSFVAELYPWSPAGSSALTFARNAHLDVLQAVLDSIASVPSGPLTTARTVYCFGMSMATAWMQASPSTATGATVSGVKDTWNFDVKYGSGPLSDTDAAIWLVHAITQLMPNFLPSYDAAPLLAAERAWFHWTVEQQDAEIARVCLLNGWVAYKAAYDAWWAYRQADGYNSAAAGAYVATVADLPNIATPLEVAGTADPPGNEQWTPLLLATVPPKTQSYLGFRWSQVVSTCLSAQNMSDMLTVAAPLFPTAPERAAEVGEVLNITAALTDEQKTIAELWAGGPLTCTPPGQFAWMWKDFMVRLLGKNLSADSTAGEVNTQVLSLLDLGVSLFEGSRVVWDVKATYKQGRPIQEIRHRYYNQLVSTWNSPTPVAAQTWVPYQMSNFVTPPFADFSSGHSYFSHTFAQCMTYWFGATIPALRSLDLPKSELVHFTPLYKDGPDVFTDVPYASFTIEAGSSEIQPGVVPATSLTISFTTWSQLATQVGFSRLYGGIHCISAHSASVALSDALYPLLQSKWHIEKLG